MQSVGYNCVMYIGLTGEKAMFYALVTLFVQNLINEVNLCKVLEPETIYLMIAYYLVANNKQLTYQAEQAK